MPRKNVLSLGGKPLIAWTIETALAVNLKARILVTSDDEEILAVAEEYGHGAVVLHRRPDAMATDIATTSDVLIDAVQAEHRSGFPPDTLVLLQPTSPLRIVDDIWAAIAKYEEVDRSDTVVSVCSVDHPAAWIGRIDDCSRLKGIDVSKTRSQDHGCEYRLNGAVYIVDVVHLMNHNSLFTPQLRASIMPRERSFDIDNAIDFRICEALIDG